MEVNKGGCDAIIMNSPSVLSRRERKKLDCKYTILRAARELLQERGMEASVEEIANRADISYPTFYNYFPTKAGLFYAIYLEEIEDLREFAALELGGEACATVRVERIFQALLQDFIRYPYLDLFIAGEVARHTAQTGEEEQISRLFTDEIAAGQLGGEFRPDIDARHYALLMAGILFSASFYSCNEADSMDMLRILLSGIRVKP